MNAALEFILEQIRGAWRFRWIAMLVAWIVCLVGWLVVLAMPDTYSAWARVYVDTRTRLSQVTQGIAVDSNIASQAEAVRQALLGGPQLEKVSRLADFKRQNAGLVPGATGDYFTHLHGETDNLDKDRLALTVAEQKRDELRRQLSSELPLMGSSAGIRNAAGDGASGADTASAIRETQARLDELLLRFTDKHPDVIAARRTLEDLKKRQQVELQAVRHGDQAAIAASGLAANPVYQGIKLQLSQAEVEVAAARRQVADREGRIAELRKMINTAPQVEAEYARLNRDYDVTRGQYQALVERLNRAKLADKAEATGVVRFEVVDPPTGSEQPVSPDRIRLILVVLLGGLAAGVGAAYVMHQLRPVFVSARQLTEVTQLPVLGVVSMTWLEGHQALARHAVWVYCMAAAVLFAVAAMMLLTQSATAHFLHGLIA